MKQKITKLFIILMITLISLFSCQNPAEEAEQTETLNNEIIEESGPDDSSRGTIKKPFPQHINDYNHNDMAKPDGYGPLHMDIKTRKYYDKWKANYLWYGNLLPSSSKYAYVKQSGYAGAPDNCNYETTSEAMGYGMIIMVVMAGYEPDAKKYFDAMYRTVRACRSKGNSNLMSWLAFGPQYYPSNLSKRSYSASDGDMDIAYALLMAYKQWGNTYYRTEARKRIKAIYDSNINYKGTNYPRINLGDWASDSISGLEAKWKKASRISDWMPSHFRAFRNYETNTTRRNQWRKLLDRTDNLIATTDHNTTGLVPDFCTGTSNMDPVGANFMEGAYDGKYFYNACRYPLRLACYISQYFQPYWVVNPWGPPRYIKSVYQKYLTRLVNWARNKYGYNNADDIRAGYHRNGNNLPDNNYDSPAFIGPITAGAIVRNFYINRRFLRSGFDYLVDNFIPIDSPWGSGYFESTIGLLSMFVISGNWWRP